ncbi:ABC transporter ATP-binding protein [Metabacillus endolithicus]|uniref:ABC transporter ATP-binding protein n=1 Tax=Metabacillus endolithicus TaxID=1535204 RepID=A0ABW5BSQ6_9BACI
MNDPLLEMKELSIVVKHTNQTIIQSLSFTIYSGDMVGIVGESGSGKSVTAQAILGSIPTSFNMGGSILFEGEYISFQKKNKFIGTEICYIPQDYSNGFSPFFKIGSQMNEQLATHTSLSKKQRKKRILDMLERVQLPAEKVYSSYHFELSGGQLQRVVIASAMILNPKLLICDEITTALDPKNADQIMQLLKDLQTQYNTAIIFISHQLHHVMNYCDQLAVMYGGEWMEYGLTTKIKKNPTHPYTQLLLNTIPTIKADAEHLQLIPGEPGEVNREGCPFATRCPYCEPVCLHSHVTLKGTPLHQVACHLVTTKEGEGTTSDSIKSPVYI